MVHQLIAAPSLAGVTVEALVEEVAARVRDAHWELRGLPVEPDEEEQLANLAGAASSDHVYFPMSSSIVV